MRMVLIALLAIGLCLASTSGAEPIKTKKANKYEALIAKIKAVGKEGTGNPAAAAAWKELLAGKGEAMMAILAAMDDDNRVTSNWLRTAFDAMAEKTIADQKRLPAAAMERFIANTKHPSCARRLAFEWLSRVASDTPGRLLPGMLKDPSPELRRDAVALAIKIAEELAGKKAKEEAVAEFHKALSGACDQDQVDAIAKRLKELGETVDLAKHFGMIPTWYLAAPFDNTGEKGFAKVYPPEKGVDLNAVYEGKDKAEVRWVETTSADPYGLIDLNKALGKKKSAVAYAFTAIDSPTERLVQVRLGCINASKIWVNGKEVFAKDEYHHGSKLDQYIATATLKAGQNQILVKICQNNQTDSWAQDWKFQARLTDFAGATVPWKLATRKTAKK